MTNIPFFTLISFIIQLMSSSEPKLTEYKYGRDSFGVITNMTLETSELVISITKKPAEINLSLSGTNVFGSYVITNSWVHPLGQYYVHPDGTARPYPPANPNTNSSQILLEQYRHQYPFLK